MGGLCVGAARMLFTRERSAGEKENLRISVLYEGPWLVPSWKGREGWSIRGRCDVEPRVLQINCNFRQFSLSPCY